MYVRQINVRRFRHLHEITLGPFREPPRSGEIVAIAGPNGGGKSSVLELLGLALSNAWSIGYPASRTMPESSFEIELGISQPERQLMMQSLAQQQQESQQTSPALTYLEDHSSFFRSTNYEGGRYNEDPGVQNIVYNAVTQFLRGELQRSFGFFLRADRYYPQRGFAKDQIFNFATTRQRQHALTSSFSLTHEQYSQMFDYLVQLRYHYFVELGQHQHARNNGMEVGSPPQDPLIPFDALLQRLFPDYRFAEESGAVPSDLFITLPSGETIPFNDLSGGEKEVFFILSYFLRHDVAGAIILIDEPELHLHPELARTLIQQMMEIQPANQIWVATHSPEIIDEAGRDSVTYIARDPNTHLAVTTSGPDEAETVTALRDLFGLSGYIGVAPKVVFLEGTTVSADRKAFSSLFPHLRRHLKLIPAGGVDNQHRINSAIMAILEANLGWMQFYSIRDRDFLTNEMVAKYESHPSGNTFVLQRYSIENYLIVPEIMQSVLDTVYSVKLDAEAILAQLKDIALRMSSECTAAMISYRLNLLFRPEDFDLGHILHSQSLVNPDGSLSDERLNILQAQFAQRVAVNRDALQARVEAAALEPLIVSCAEEIRESLDGSDWIKRFPGKALLNAFVASHSLGKEIIFYNSMIKEMSGQQSHIPFDLVQTIEKIAGPSES